MIIAIFPHLQHPHAIHLAIGIEEFLRNEGVTVVAEDADAAKINAKPLSKVDPKKIDFMISMGGDGTILGLVHKYEAWNAAVLGINLGHLGFMADVPVDDIYPSLKELLSKSYKIEERLMLQGETLKKERCFAVNDIVIHRGKNPYLIEIAIHVDGNYLNTFEADGVIIAPPNGSTAYSLAAGGPILHPMLEAVVITPISPHTISNRPIVLPPNHEIQLQYMSEYEPAEVRADGLAPFHLRTGEVFRITKSEKRFRLVHLRRHDYYNTLRTKLGWTGKLRTN